MASPNSITLTFKIHQDEDPPDGDGVDHRRDPTVQALNDLNGDQLNGSYRSQPEGKKEDKSRDEALNLPAFGSKYCSSTTPSFGSICKSTPVIFGTAGASTHPFGFSLFELRENTSDVEEEVGDVTVFSSASSSTSDDDSDTESHMRLLLEDAASDIKEIESKLPCDRREKIALRTQRYTLPLSPWKNVAESVSANRKGKLSGTNTINQEGQKEATIESSPDTGSQSIDIPSINDAIRHQVSSKQTNNHEDSQHRSGEPTARTEDESDSGKEEEKVKEISNKGAAAFIQQKVNAARDSIEERLGKEMLRSKSPPTPPSTAEKRIEKQRKNKEARKSVPLEITWATTSEGSFSLSKNQQEKSQFYAPLLGYHGPDPATSDFPPLKELKVRDPLSSSVADEKVTKTFNRTISYACAVRNGRPTSSVSLFGSQVKPVPSPSATGTSGITTHLDITELEKHKAPEEKSLLILKPRSEAIVQISKEETITKNLEVKTIPSLKEQILTSSTGKNLTPDELNWLLQARLIDDEKFRHNVLLREVMTAINDVFMVYLYGRCDTKNPGGISLIDSRSSWLLDFLSRPPKHFSRVPTKRSTVVSSRSTFPPRPPSLAVTNSAHSNGFQKMPLPGQKRELVLDSQPPSKRTKTILPAPPPSLHALPPKPPTTGPTEYLHRIFGAMSSSDTSTTAPVPHIPVSAYSRSAYYEYHGSLQSLAPLRSLLLRRQTINDSIHMYSVTDVISTLRFARAIQKSGDFLPQLPPSLSAKVSRAKFDNDTAIPQALLKPIQTPVQFILMHPDELYVLEKCVCWILNVEDIDRVDLKHFENNRTNSFNLHVGQVLDEVRAIIAREKEAARAYGDYYYGGGMNYY